MKKQSLQLIVAYAAGKTYHRLNAMKIALFAILLCGMGNVSLAQTTITLSTPTAIAASNVCPGATNVNIYAFTLTGTATTGTNFFTDLTFTQAGNAVNPTDIVQYKLWKNAGAGAGILVSTGTSPIFSNFITESFALGTVTNYWITADITTTPTAGRTITVSPLTAANLNTTGPKNGAGTLTGGTQTVRALPTLGSGFTITPNPICVGTTLTLTATGTAAGTGGLLSYNWTGPNAYSTATLTNTQTYAPASSAASGVYSVSVTYPGFGCTSAAVQSASVTVNQAPVLPANRYICIGDSTTINSGNSSGTWTSSNPLVATVSPGVGNGYVHAVSGAGGVTTITNFTTCGSAVTSATVAVRPSRILGNLTICTMRSTTLSSATAGGTWSSSLPSVATVTSAGSTGTVTGTASLAPGSGATTIFYTNITTGCDTSQVVTVNPSPSPLVGPTSVCMNYQIQLTDVTLGGTWSSDNLPVATVTGGPGAAGGLVTGVSVGTAVISYTLLTTGCYNSSTVTVKPLPSPIIGDSIVCNPGSTILSDATPGGTWSSQFPTVAYVTSPTNPTVNGVGAGGTNITYTSGTNGCFVLRSMQVNQHADPINGPTQVCAGDSITLTDAVPLGTWSSSNILVATVPDQTRGEVYGQYATAIPQTANIIYGIPRCPTVQYTVTVNPAPGPIVGVPNVCVGFVTNLSDTTAGGAWSNSDLTGATDAFVAPGPATVQGNSVGFSIITYTLISSGCYVTQPLIVYPNPAPIVGPTSICQGSVDTLTDATAGGTWSSTMLSIARIVDSSGVVTGISAGSVNISYTLSTGCYAVVSPFIVKPPVIASVGIGPNPIGLICDGTIETFTATPVNGGTPDYQWYKFTTPTSDSATFINNPTTNGDLIVVRMTAHGTCAVNPIVYDSVILTVYPIAGAQVTISSLPATTTATYLGEVYTFFANVTFGGMNPSYQWYNNGVAIPGATGISYATPVYADDNFTFRVISTSPCDPLGAADTAFSVGITIHATYLGVSSIPVVKSNLSLFPNPTSGNVTLTGTIDNALDEEVTIEVSDMLGHVVYKSTTIPQNGVIRDQLNLDNNLAAGTYLLHASSEHLSQVFRFVISK